MPAENPTNVIRGEYSEEPRWSPPQVAVDTNIRSPEAAPTQFEQLRDAVFAAGRAVASGLGATASIRQNLDALKRQAMQMDSNLRAPGQSLQHQRLVGLKARAVDLQVQAESKGPRWLADQTKRLYDNSPSNEEKILWGDLHLQAAHATEVDAAQAAQDEDTRTRQDYSRAAVTAHNVVTKFDEMIDLDSGLRNSLIGDGRNIGKRVQDHILTELAEIAPGLFVISKDDPDSKMKLREREYLTAQAIGYSNSITDKLVKQYGTSQDNLSQSDGSRQMDADVFDYLKGSTSEQDILDSYSVMQRAQLAHMTPDQQRGMLRERVTDAIQHAAQADFPGTMADLSDKVAGLATMSVGGRPLFSQEEQVEIANQFMKGAEDAADKMFDTEVGRKLAVQRVSIIDGLGRVSYLPDPNAAANMSIPGPTGFTPAGEAGNAALERLGILGKDPNSLSPFQLRLLERVTGKVESINAHGRDEAQRRANNIRNLASVQSGLPGGDENKAYKFSSLSRAQTGEPLMPQEAATNRAMVTGAASRLGVEDPSIKSWDGASPPPMDQSHRPLRSIIQKIEASQWSDPNVITRYKMPKEMLERKFSDFTSGDTEKFHDAISFAGQLGSERSLEDLLIHFEESKSGAAAAMYYSMVASKGLIGVGDSGATVRDPITGAAIKPDMGTVEQQAKAIIAAGSVQEWLGKMNWQNGTPTGTNRRSIDTAMLALLRTKDPWREGPGVPEVPSDNVARRTLGHSLSDTDIEDLLRNEFAEPSMVDTIHRLGEAILVTHPEATIETVAPLIYSHLVSLGVKPQVVGNRLIGIRDPHGHTGSDWSDLPAAVNDYKIAPFSQEHQVLLNDAMGYGPLTAPRDLAGLYRAEFPQHFPVTVPKGDFRMDVSLGVQEGGVETLSRPANEFGGMPVSVFTPSTNTPLPPIRSKFDVFVKDQMGRDVKIPKGTIVSVFSMHNLPAQYMLHSNNPAPGFESWARENHPELFTGPEPSSALDAGPYGTNYSAMWSQLFGRK